jgi:hypothetical protein
MKTLVTLALLAATATAQDAGRDEAVRKLSTLKVSVEFDKIRLQDALDYLRDVSGLNVVVAPSALAKEGDATVSLKAKDLSVKSVLKLMLHGRGLAATWRDGALVVLPTEELGAATTMRIYDVRSHLLKLDDHPGPRMELNGPNASGHVLPGLTIDLSEPKVLMEPEFLVELVKANTGGRSWESNPNAGIDLADGRLVVTQSAGVHAEIDAFLRRMAAYR